MSASLTLQEMLVAALSDVPGISGIYDGPPPDALPPYLVLGADLVTDWSTKTERGHEHRIAINAWAPGPGAAVVKPILGAIEARLVALAGVRDGLAVVSTQLLRTLVLTDAEGWTQGIIEFRVRTLG
ncbi:MAG: hypothetical protein RL490_329 [Pseudomonadota bacterium]|jgi:hypothetical protein